MAKLLLLEDDPISAAFLAEVLAALPAIVDCANSCADAQSLALAGGHALWLFDANLPDGSGAGLLERLRAAGLMTRAIALTAETCPDRLAALSRAGFVDVLPKPIAASSLLASTSRHLGIQAAPASSLWNEQRALTAVGGKAESARALRELFLAELPAQVESVRHAFATADHATVRDHLHRMKASCGFVGADRLLLAVNRLATDMDSPSLQEFVDRACRQIESASITAGAV
jgi:CheY-like chemotaxis protein